MERLFLLEAVTPSYVGKYEAARNLEAIWLMRQTIENRLESPREYGARGARTTTDIIELGNQFAGFGSYPVLSTAMAGIWLIYFGSPIAHAITAATEPIFPPRAAFVNVTA